MLSDVRNQSRSIDCFFVAKRMSDMVDEKSPQWIAEQIKEHLDECNACRRLFTELRLATDAVAQVQRHKINPKAVDNLVERLTKSNPAGNFLGGLALPRPLVITAEIVFVVLITVGLIAAFPQIKPKIVQFLDMTKKEELAKAQEEIDKNFSTFAPEVEDNVVHEVFFQNWASLTTSAQWDPGPRPMPEASKPKPKVVAQADPPKKKATPTPPKPVAKAKKTSSTPQKTTAPPKKETPVVAQKPTPEKKPLAPKPVKTKQEAKPQPAAVVTNRFSFYTFVMTAHLPEAEINTKVTAILEKLGATKAGKSKFGEILNGGLYYHFFISDENYPVFKKELGSVGGFRERIRKSNTKVPEGKHRLALWIGFPR